MAARRLRPDERILDIATAEHVEGYEVRSARDGAAVERRILTDAAPAGYVDRLATEHGEVRLAPAVDQLLRRLRAARRASGDGRSEP